MAKSAGVHLVGSVAMPDAESVFRAVSGKLGPWLKRLPDGETGERGRWVYWQRDKLIRHPDMELDKDTPPLLIREWNGRLIRTTELVRFRAGADAGRAQFETGYAPAAIESYGVFKRLRDEGIIPAGVRFQVCLPTAMAPGFMYVSPSSHPAFLQSYERALLDDLAAICAAIPHDDLSIQWDVCQEVLIFENYFPTRPPAYKDQIFAELARLCDAVPANVDCGVHLCYGSPADAHLVMPKDMGILVEIAVGFMPRVKRNLNFLHLPVPQDRADDAYFAPLRELKLSDATELYLGLIHHDDAQGDRARIAAARKAVTDFGISTECGWGRADPAKVAPLIRAHRLAVEEI